MPVHWAGCNENGPKSVDFGPDRTAVDVVESETKHLCVQAADADDTLEMTDVAFQLVDAIVVQVFVDVNHNITCTHNFIPPEMEKNVALKDQGHTSKVDQG
jgi:hypothetical protein